MAAEFTVIQARKSRERKGITSRSSSEPAPRIGSGSLNLEMASRFRQWLLMQKYSRSTIDRYHRIACKLCHFIGRKPLSAVNAIDIADFLKHTLPDRWADSYISDQLGPLRSFFDFLYLGGVVDSVAPRFLKARARSRSLPRALTQAQVRKLIQAAAHPRDRALIEMLYATGCRIGELRMARVEDIDFRRRTLRVRGKRRERVVYFGAKAGKSLKIYLNRRQTGYIFQDKIEPQKGYLTYYKKAWIGNWRDYRTGKKRSKWLGNPSRVSRTEAPRRLKYVLQQQRVNLIRQKPDRPLHRSALSFVVRELGRRAKVGSVSPHVLRHCFATHLLERGADIRAIQELLGHAYLTSTQVYTRISNSAVRSAFKTFHPRS